MELGFDESKNIATIRLTGPLDRGTILDAFDAAVADERYRMGMGRLWDFRDADLSGLDSATIAEMAKHSMKFPPGINDVKVAFVASRKLEYGLSRMFAAFSSRAMTSIAVFVTMDEAEAWMAGEDLGQVSGAEV
jgi:hypothetical protein